MLLLPLTFYLDLAQRSTTYFVVLVISPSSLYFLPNPIPYPVVVVLSNKTTWCMLIRFSPVNYTHRFFTDPHLHTNVKQNVFQYFLVIAVVEQQEEKRGRVKNNIAMLYITLWHESSIMISEFEHVKTFYVKILIFLNLLACYLVKTFDEW